MGEVVYGLGKPRAGGEMGLGVGRWCGVVDEAGQVGEVREEASVMRRAA